MSEIGARVTVAGICYAALEPLEHKRPNGARLDVQLCKTSSYVVAEELIATEDSMIFTIGLEIAQFCPRTYGTSRD